MLSDIFHSNSYAILSTSYLTADISALMIKILGSRLVWPIEKGCLLLLGTWYHFLYIWRSVSAYLFLRLVISTCDSRLIIVWHPSHFMKIYFHFMKIYLKKEVGWTLTKKRSFISAWIAFRLTFRVNLIFFLHFYMPCKISLLLSPCTVYQCNLKITNYCYKRPHMLNDLFHTLYQTDVPILTLTTEVQYI
jgi:hypothetical protein